LRYESTFALRLVFQSAKSINDPRTANSREGSSSAQFL
jgi:hypothetical protein